ncbi:hypothetical protein Hypma_016176 [Hypsizygus marmoreus]|uniref:INO80 complex subunit B-like conserved region domain-containing protein n=1 Tax=Hypsizygus marmoreus TaxID=39966 RepID=A0A369J0R9_HYPMA|nr:hypothetical protein Hypma_016176 [Hypsizygus marmoreus]
MNRVLCTQYADGDTSSFVPALYHHLLDLLPLETAYNRKHTMPVTTRPRRSTRSRTTRMIDMEMDSDGDVEMAPEPPRIGRRREQEDEEGDDEGEEEVEAESNVDVEAVAEGDAEENDDEDDEPEEEDEDEEEDAGDEEEDDQEDEIQSDADAQPIPSSSRLKIRLKVPHPPPTRYESPMVESEDSTSDSQPSTSTTRPMTTRQAVLASVLDSTHVSLTGSRQKKAPLNETELALRREETARKRKNLTEKKLEDEKAETINRLLKKQSKPRTKRTTAQRTDRDMDDVPPGSIVATRSNSVSAPKRKIREELGEAGDEEEEEGEGDDRSERDVPLPTMYRWISTSRVPVPPAVDADGDVIVDAAPTMRISFSVPLSVRPAPPPVGENESQAQTEAVLHPLQPCDNENEDERRRNTRPKVCAAPGCGKPVRYRLVRDWAQGACGMTCLKTLEAAEAV